MTTTTRTRKTAAPKSNTVEIDAGSEIVTVEVGAIYKKHGTRNWGKAYLTVDANGVAPLLFGALMKTAFFGDAQVGDHIAFKLPDGEHTGIVTSMVRRPSRSRQAPD